VSGQSVLLLSETPPPLQIDVETIYRLPMRLSLPMGNLTVIGVVVRRAWNHSEWNLTRIDAVRSRPHF
jgi:hypothetical protein